MFFIFHASVLYSVGSVFKKKKNLLVMEISNILTSKEDNIIMSPHMPVVLLQYLGNCFSLFSHCSCVCLCACVHKYMCIRVYVHMYTHRCRLSFLVYVVLCFMCSNNMFFKIRIKPIYVAKIKNSIL